MRTWFKTNKTPVITNSFYSYGARDYFIPKSVSGMYGYLPSKLYKELIQYNEGSVREFNFKVPFDGWRRSFVIGDYKNLDKVSLYYIAKYYSLLLITYIWNIFIKLANRAIDYSSLNHLEAEVLLRQGKFIGNMTHVGCARQYWWKFEAGKLYEGGWSNDPNEVKDWEEVKELPTFWKYKIF